MSLFIKYLYYNGIDKILYTYLVDIICHKMTQFDTKLLLFES